ncbi:MAG: polysaccharide biosynthesis/export family protein [Desulfobacterales bacterium]|nr:MAG: polysaccharide biosynthesis/export family protein [Desulfobacterales bacterium]
MQKRPSHTQSILITAALLITLSIGVLNCSKKSSLVDRYSAAPVKNKEITRINEQLFAKAQIGEDPSDYLLGAGDLLQITVFEADTLNTKTRVSSRGYITLPLLGQIQVKGLTAREAEMKIEALYRQKYIKDPHVSVFVQEHISQRVTLVGQFKEPGTYDYFSRQRLLDVMALAGGFSEKAGRTIQVRRKSTKPGESNIFLIDRDQLFKEGRTELNIEIVGGDTIFVPAAGHFFIDGAIRSPGNYPITKKMLIKDALLAAGGTRPYADKEHLVLIRHVKGEGRKIFELKYDNPEHLKMEIQDHDIIIVEASTWGKIVHGGRINIGIPGLGVGYADPEQ